MVVRQRTSAQDATKSTTAPLSASARYKLVCELRIQLSGEGCVTLGRARQLCRLPDGCQHSERNGQQNLPCHTGRQSTSLAWVGSPSTPQPSLSIGSLSKTAVMGRSAGQGLDQMGREGPKICTTLLKGDVKIRVMPEMRAWTPRCVSCGDQLAGSTFTTLPCHFLVSRTLLSTCAPAVSLRTLFSYSLHYS